MATLTPTLTLTSTDATSDELSFSVTDTLTVKEPSVGLSKVSATTTGGDNIILASHSSIRYLFLLVFSSIFDLVFLSNQYCSKLIYLPLDLVYCLKQH